MLSALGMILSVLLKHYINKLKLTSDSALDQQKCYKVSLVTPESSLAFDEHADSEQYIRCINTL